MTETPILVSRIHAVTVHVDGALVCRRAALEASAGAPATVRISDLPLAASGRPVRARVRGGTAEVVSCRLVAMPAPPDPGRDNTLIRAVEEAEDAVEAVGRRVAAALARLRALNVLEPPARPDPAKGQAPPASPAAARFELLRFRDAQSERLAADLARARQDEEQVSERLAQAQAMLAAARNARAARAGALCLAAEVQLRWAATGDPGWIELEYTVPGARWAPSYVLRFDPGLGRVVIELRGLVAQRSGEDWSGVRVACATAPLQGWCDLPRLAGRRIGRAQPPPPSAWRPAPSGAEALFADWDAFAAVQPRPVPTVRAIGGVAADDEEPASVGAAMDEEVCEDRECAKSRPPPPASMMAMASPSLRPGAPEKKKERSSVRRMVSRASAAGGASVREEVESYAAMSADAAPPAEPEPGLEPGAALLDFAALRLADADDGGRGRPRPMGAFRDDRRWSNACAAARRRSTDLRPPPPGHQPVSPARYAVRWEGELPVDVPADGGWHVVPLAAGASDVRLTLVVVPRESRTAFRSAALTNPFDRALTAGPADVYVGADFLLTARLSDIASGTGADLGLGVEASLAVARNATFTEESAGMLGGSLHLRHSVRVSLHNKGGRRAAIEVRERLPQPDEQVEHCTVKELTVAPAWEPWRPEETPLPGGRRWRLTLEPDATGELAYEYRVEIPSKNELVGGNRREA